MVGSDHCTLDDFHLQVISFYCAGFHQAVQFLESSPVQEAPGADLSCDDLGSVSAGPACLFEAGIAGLLSGHIFINGSLKEDGQFHKVYGVGGLENDILLLVCRGNILGNA